jgi:hypothetical protein
MNGTADPDKKNVWKRTILFFFCWQVAESVV